MSKPSIWRYLAHLLVGHAWELRGPFFPYWTCDCGAIRDFRP